MRSKRMKQLSEIIQDLTRRIEMTKKCTSCEANFQTKQEHDTLCPKCAGQAEAVRKELRETAAKNGVEKRPTQDTSVETR
jgi:Zn finger protein HypA/HybF involved in hydrogenase expression